MNKKIFILIIILILTTVVMSGCSGGFLGCGGGETITLATGSNANWRNENHYEKTVYAVERYAYGEKDENGKYVEKKIAEGSYTYELIGIKTPGDIPVSIPKSNLGLSGETHYNYSLLRITGELVYNDKSDGLDGKIDTATSELLFYTSDLLPIYLSRTENYQSDGNALEIKTDYINGVNTVKINGNVTETQVKKGVYDNDLILYVMRARSTLVSGGSDTLEIFSPKDSAVQGKAVSFQMAFSTTTTFTNESDRYLYVDSESKFIPNCFKQLPEKTDDGYKLERMYTGVGINDKNSGPYTYVSYAADSFNILGQTTSKVCLQIETFEYDAYAPTATPAFSMRWKITDYSITK